MVALQCASGFPRSQLANIAPWEALRSLRLLTLLVHGALFAGSWSHTKEAVAVGTLTCSRRACESPELDVAKYDLMFPKEFSLSKTRGEATRKLFHEESPVTEWSRGGVQYALSPVFVCKVPTKTVGLGDSISASGLERSVFRR